MDGEAVTEREYSNCNSELPDTGEKANVDIFFFRSEQLP